MNLEKICKSIIYGGIFLIPFLAFVVVESMFFPFITGKNFAFRIIVEIIFFAWILLALYRPQYRLKRSGIAITIAIFLGIIFIANIFGENFSQSFWSNFERMEGFVTLLHLGMYFVVLASVMNTKLWKYFFLTTISASTIMAFFYAIPEYFETVRAGGVLRLDTTFGNPIYLAVYALFHIFLAWFYLVRYTVSRYLKWILGGVIALNTLVLYYTATRGDLLGLIVGLGVVAIIIALFEKENKNFRKIAIGTILAGIIAIGGFIGIKNTDFVQNSPVLVRFANISLEDNTTKARFMVWEMAYEAWKEKPVLGWGQGNFNIAFNKYYDPKMYAQEPFFDRAHNVFLDWLVAGGVLGLVAYLLIFVVVLYSIWMRREDEVFSLMEKSIVTGLLTAYFFQNLFVFDNIISYILFFTILAYIHTCLLKIKTDKNKKAFTIPIHFIVPVVIVVAVFTIHLFNTKAILTNKALLQGLVPHEEGISKNIEYFKKAIYYDTFGNAEVREQLTQTARQVLRSQKISLIQKQEIIELARREIILQAEDVPNDARYALFAGSYLGSIGSFNEAIDYLQKALDLSPRKQQILFELTSVYLNKAEYEKALEMAKRAYELEPEYDNALKVYAMSAIYANNYELAKKLLVPKYGTIAISDDRILNAFVKVGDYERVVEIWKKRISDLQKKGLDNAQYHTSLAATYLEMGKRSEAISELKKAMELNPEFKQQGEYYINEIKAGRNP